MKLLAGAAVAVGLCLVPPAGAHPGHGGDAVTVNGDGFSYSPSTITVGVGDAVVWFWEGDTFRNHSVTSSPAQAEQFDSDPGGPPTNASHPVGSSFSHVFQTEGRFTYYCKNHATTMQGVVEVVPRPVPAAKPRLSGLRISTGKKDTTARFRLSAAAEIVGRISERRDERWVRVKTFYRRAGAGNNRIELPVRGFEDGPYHLRLVAYDELDSRSNVVEQKFAL